MKSFNNDEPLVYIHLFKTGGTSMNTIFRDIYVPEKRFVKHNVYKNITEDVKKLTCTSENIQRLKKIGMNNPVFQGHFERAPHYYFPDECNQFITTIRNPFEQMVSGYYHAKYKTNQPLVGGHSDVESYILQYPYAYSLNRAFESKINKKITLRNFKEILEKYFIAIGSLLNFQKTLDVFEGVLNRKVPNREVHINKHSAPQGKYIVPEHLRDLHRELYPLEYAIYDWVNEKYNY